MVFRFKCETCSNETFYVEVERDPTEHEDGVARALVFFHCCTCGRAHETVDAEIAFAADYGFVD